MFEAMKRKMEKVLTVVQEDLNLIKTGRAKPSLVENIQIEAYPGSRMSLVELASITAPDPQMLLIQPWDQSVIKKIAADLSKSELQLNPAIDGQVIRITIPPLTEERRRDMVKLVKQKVESGKEMLRSVRNDTKKDIDAQKGESGVSEDDIRSWLEEMQDIYESFAGKVEDLGEAKEKELLTL